MAWRAVGPSWIAWVLFFVAPLSLAHPPKLIWDAPEDCPQGAEVAEEIERLAPAHMDEEEHLFRGSVVHLGENSWSVTITRLVPAARSSVPDASEAGQNAEKPSAMEAQRTLEGQSCAEVTQAAIAVLAMTLSPPIEHAAAEEALPEPPEEPAQSSAPVTSPKSEDPDASLRPPWFVRAHTGLEVTTLPRVAPTFGLTLGIPIGPLLIGLGGSYAWGEATSSERGARISMAVLDVSICYRRFGQRVFGGVCLLGSGGAAPARGLSEAGTRAAGRLLAVGGGGEVGYRLTSSLALHLGIRAQAHLWRDRFFLGKAEVYRISTVMVRPELGLEWQFW